MWTSAANIILAIPTTAISESTLVEKQASDKMGSNIRGMSSAFPL